VNKNIALFAAAVVAGLTVVGVVAANAQAKVDNPALVRVDVTRGAQCGGEAHYLIAPKDPEVLTDVGPRGFTLPIIIPCARIDAVDALLPLPSNRAGKLTVQTQRVDLHLRDDGTCYADLVRTLTPTDTDLIATLGTQPLAQRIDPIACTRLTQALVGAQIRKTYAGPWPQSVVALPLALEP
jgi:hypothetical protein